MSESIFQAALERGGGFNVIESQLLAKQPPLAEATTAARETVERTLICPPSPAMSRQSEDAQRCRPEAVVYNLPCTEQTANCFLVKQHEWANQRAKLHRLLGEYPAVRGSDDYRRRVRWCMDVCRAVSQALDATNIRPAFMRPWKIEDGPEPPPDPFQPVLDWWAAVYERSARSLGVADLGTAIVTPIAPTLGGLGGQDPAKLPEVNYDPITPQNTRSELTAVGELPTSGGWPFVHGRIVTNRQYEDRGDRAYSFTGETHWQHLFRVHPGYTIEPAQYGWRSCMDRSVFGYACGLEWHPLYVLGGLPTMDYCKVWAETILQIDLSAFVVSGVMNWVRSLIPFARNGTLAIPEDELRTHYEELSRDRARAMTQSVGALVGGAMAPFGLIGAIFAAAYNLIMLVLVELLPMAAAWSCPSIPFKRTIGGAQDCAVTTAQGMTDDGELQADRIRNTVLPSWALMTGIDSLAAFRDRPPESAPTDLGPPPTPPPVPEGDPSKKPVPWGTVALVAGGLVGGAVLLRLLRGRS